LSLRFKQATESLRSFGTGIVQRYPHQLVSLMALLLLGGASATFALATLAPDAADLPARTVVQEVATLPLRVQADALAAHTQMLYRSEVSRSTDTAESLLKRLGVIDADAAAFLRSSAHIQQNLLGRSGRALTAEAAQDNTLIQLVARWSPEDDGMFKRLTVEKSATGWVSRIEILPMTASSRLVSGTIHSSLFAATDDARIPDAIAIQVAEIFSGDIDFHRALRKGDRFSIVYETLEGDGEPLRAGRVLSSEFVNAGKSYQAMWFQEPIAGLATTASHNLSKGGYYTLSGESLRRAFLASPMEFSRVTSGFKMRFHPILRSWRAHLGVDYGAPTGTPVRSVGDGVVEFAGVQNGFGNVVMVKHRADKTTVYAHLSRIAVRKGQSVSQGQNLGAVGQTGWATGPHLHFEFRVNGQQRDPLSVARQSESIPVAAASMPQFLRAAALVRSQLTAAAHMQVASAQ
jgi:murein DD-endopeptidase MepM/ murein hydrolase activator NlpD